MEGTYQYFTLQPPHRPLYFLPISDGKHKKDGNEEIGNTIWSILVTIINAALFTSTPLTRWKKVIPIMIEKRKQLQRSIV